MPTELMDELGISNEDMASLNQNGYLPLTKKAAQALAKHKELVASIRLNTDAQTGDLYPLDAYTGLDTRQLWSDMDTEKGSYCATKHEEYRYL